MPTSGKSHGVDGSGPDHGDSTRHASSATGRPRAQAGVDSKVWAFIGDGGGRTSPSRSAPSRSPRARRRQPISSSIATCSGSTVPCAANGQIIPELEAVFRGAAGTSTRSSGKDWDPLLAKDKDGLLVKRMGEIVEANTRRTRSNPEVLRKHFWGSTRRARDGQSTSQTTI